MASATLASTAAAIPLPFSDAITIVPIQMGMIVAISMRFGIEGNANSLVPLAMSVIGCMAATAAGRIIVGQILKLVPAGSLINSVVASALTSGLGKAYLEFLLTFRRNKGRAPSVDEIASEFGDFWKRWDKKSDDTPFAAPRAILRDDG